MATNKALNLRAALAVAVLLACGMGSMKAQLSTSTNVKDSSALKPPPGYRVAIVEFEDLQCPDCARAFPVVKDAVEKYHIPWVQHDFPLPFHNWSFDAANQRPWATSSAARSSLPSSICTRLTT
jgi:hypothetical protein